MPATVKAFDHLTIATGHTNSSPRSDVEEGVISMLRSGVETGAVELEDFIFRSEPITGGWRFTISDATRPWAGDELVQCHLAAPGGSDAVWRQVRIDHAASAVPLPIAGRKPRSSVWLSAMMLPGMLGLFIGIPDLRTLSLIGMLGDAERCFAWALLEFGTPGAILKAA